MMTEMPGARPHRPRGSCSARKVSEIKEDGPLGRTRRSPCSSGLSLCTARTGGSSAPHRKVSFPKLRLSSRVQGGRGGHTPGQDSTCSPLEGGFINVWGRFRESNKPSAPRGWSPQGFLTTRGQKGRAEGVAISTERELHGVAPTEAFGRRAQVGVLVDTRLPGGKRRP